MSKSFKYLLFVILLYLYLFNPVMTITNGIGLGKLLYLLIPLCVFSYKTDFLSICRSFKKEMRLFLVIFIYTIFRFLIGGESVFVYTHFILIIELFLVPFALITVFENNGFKTEDYEKLFVNTACLATIITCLCFFIPSIGDFVKYKLLILNEDKNIWDYRGYGIAEGLTSTYGYILGIAFPYTLRQAMKNRIYFLFLPFILLSVLINARTGFIVAVVCSVFIIKKKNIPRLILLVPILLGIFYYLGNYFIVNYSTDRMSYFITDFFDEIDAMFKGDEATYDDTTLSALTGRMWILPDTFDEWIFGKGYSLFGKGSDVGYIIQLGYGGLVYIFLLSLLLIRVIKQSWMNLDPFYVNSFIAMFLILNLKSNYIPGSHTFQLMMLLYYVYIHKQKQFYL